MEKLWHLTLTEKFAPSKSKQLLFMNAMNIYEKKNPCLIRHVHFFSPNKTWWKIPLDTRVSTRKLILVEIGSSTNKKSKLSKTCDENILVKKENLKNRKIYCKVFFTKKQCFSLEKKYQIITMIIIIMTENSHGSFPPALQPGLQDCRWFHEIFKSLQWERVQGSQFVCCHTS